MNESGGLKSFEALSEAINQEKKEKTRKLFEETLKDKFEQVPQGHFSSKFPEIRSVSFIPFKPTREDERPQIHVVISYENKENVEKRTTWDIFDDGTVSGRMPSDLNVDREELKQEIIYTLEKITDDFWHETDTDILPESDPREDDVATNEKWPEKPPTVPTDRLKFMREQKKAIFGFVNKKVGFDGYHGTIFPNIVVLEHPKIGNAAYIVPLMKAVEIPEDKLTEDPDLPVSKMFNREEKDKIIDKHWGPISKEAKTRKALREQFHAERVIHTQDTWKERLQDAINKHLQESTIQEQQ